MSSSKTYIRRRLDLPPVTEGIWGCTDPLANNQTPGATLDDGSCTYNSAILGCTDGVTPALNYNPLATEDDGSCTYPPPPGSPNFIDIICGTYTMSTVEYAAGLFADLYVSDCSVIANKPVAICLHPNGNPRTNFTPVKYAKEFASRGYIGISADFGHESGGGSFSGSQQKQAVINICALIRYLRANSVALGLKKENIFVLGISAGAVTAIQTNIGSLILDTYEHFSTGSSYFDNALNSVNSAESSIPRASATQSGAANSKIHGFMSATTRPNFFYHGTTDCTVSYSLGECGMSGALDNYNAMVAYGIASKFVPYIGYGHSIGTFHDNIMLGGSLLLDGVTVDTGIVARFAGLLVP